MKQKFPSSHACSRRKRQSGVALIIVLGFLSLMVMMAVAFMIQARIERMVADSSLEGMRARQIVQTGIAAAIQDYVNASMEWTQTNRNLDMFLSGDFRDVAHYKGEGYDYSGEFYGSTNLWYGEAFDWLPASLTGDDSQVDLDDIQDMEWIWVRKRPGDRSPILGRYAYACFKLSGGVDANLLGLDSDDSQYGAATNRNNVRKMAYNSVLTKGASQSKLSQYQEGWNGFDTPAALNLLTDGDPVDGTETARSNNRWGRRIDEKTVGYLPTDNLSCYSFASIYKGNKLPLTMDNFESVMDNDKLTRLINHMLGQSFVSGEGAEVMRGNIRQAIYDYISDSEWPLGTGYPSVKDVPMFNEIHAKVALLHPSGKWQLKVTLQPEFWCPFPSEDNTEKKYYLKAPSMAVGSAQTGPESEALWVRALVATTGSDGKPNIPTTQPTFTLNSKACKTNEATVMKDRANPYSTATPFEYVFDIEDLPTNADGSIQPVSQIRIASIRFQNRWPLVFRDVGGTDHNVDSPPEKDFSIPLVATLKAPSEDGESAAEMYMEVKDPRLNHKANLWIQSSGSMGEKNTCLESAREDAASIMGYKPGNYMYCRRGPMETPAELGYIPFYSPDAPKANHPWLTLDIFSAPGIELINSLVCDTNLWQKLNENNNVYFTNGTINPYTTSTNVLCSAFYGVDYHEVPRMTRKPNRFGSQSGGAEMLSDIALLITNNVVLTSVTSKDKEKFIKDGPAGWARIFESNVVNRAWRDSGSDDDNSGGLNKNQRLALLHNTWGLFNESDNLFLVFVVAQSITEAPEKVNPVGDWSEKDDTITGERWAVALCWMDTSADAEADSGSGNTEKTREMDIIMFKYLNE